MGAIINAILAISAAFAGMCSSSAPSPGERPRGLRHAGVLGGGPEADRE